MLLTKRFLNNTRKCFPLANVKVAKVVKIAPTVYVQKVNVLKHAIVA